VRNEDVEQLMSGSERNSCSMAYGAIRWKGALWVRTGQAKPAAVYLLLACHVTVYTTPHAEK